MPDRDMFNLIFLPGFSTAESVTNVSGRGVGMDVVKTNVKKIGGTVDVQSVAGKGTAVRVKIPLTLAIIPALIVRCSGERFAIPQISLTELVRLESGKAIETVHGAPVHRLRGQLSPLVYLRKTLNVASRPVRAPDSSTMFQKSPDAQWKSKWGVRPKRRLPERSSRWAPPLGHCRSKPYSASTTPHCVVSAPLETVGRLGTDTMVVLKHELSGGLAACCADAETAKKEGVSVRMRRS
jgi:hypothetical protein